MSRNQFLVALVALAVLVGGGMWLASWKRSSYAVADERVGQRLLAGLKVDDIAQVDVADAQARVTLVRGEGGWSVKERSGFPADVEPIRDLLVKLHELKVVQAEGLTDAVKPRMQLAAPGGGAKPEETGTLVELKARDGRPVATLVLGKQATKESRMPGLGQGIPTGRYVWVAADPQRVSVVSEPFANLGAKPQDWLAKELVRLERPKSLSVIGPDGRQEWSVAKNAEAGDWKLAGGGKLDPGRAQDAASALYGLRIADAAAGVSDAEAGLDKPTLVRAATFEGWTYEVRIGKAAPQNRRYVKTNVTGAAPEARTPAADEKPEDKEKNEKAFTERKDLLAAKLAREKAVAGQTVLVDQSSLEPLLRERSALLAQPKAAKKQAR